ncbi:MAG: hypothetical protein QHG99_09100 [Methanomicrobiales archaeon]|nr:hypothetical protein [Methanomicrobiales archaeon]
MARSYSRNNVAIFNQTSVGRKYFQKSLLILLFSLLTIALLISWNAPATEYEASIYHSTPLIFWISILSSAIAGIIFSILSLSRTTANQDNLWKIWLFLIFLCYSACLGLFILRGYHMWCISGDPASHIGWIAEILTNGFTPKSVHYPITHIYLSQISLLSDLDLVFLHKIIPLIFGLLCVVFIYLLSHYITSNRIAPVLAVIISCSFLLGWYLNLTPNALSNMLFPLALLLIYKNLKENDFRWAILLLIVVILYPVFHTIPAIFLGMIFLTICTPKKLSGLWNFVLKRQKLFRKEWKMTDFRLAIPFIILIIWFIFWISLFSTWGYTVRSIYDTISAEGGPSKIENLVDQVSYASGYGYNVYEIILKQLGGPFIVFILALLAFPVLWNKYLKEQKEGFLLSLYGPLGVLCMFIPVLYFFNLAFGPLRLLIYVTMIGSVISAYVLSYILIKSQNNKNQFTSWSVKLIVIVLLSGLFIGGMLNLYTSPYNLTTSYQTTKSEVMGMGFFFENRDTNIPLTGITIAPGRFAAMLLTPNERSIQRLPMYLEGYRVPWHFGYDRYTSVASSFERETNLITTQRDKVIYTDYFPEIAEYRFTNEDFIRLTNDDGINLFYSNGGFDLWSISGTRQKAL